MADVAVLIVNPTDASVTVNSDVALPMAATALTIADGDSDLWIAASCAILPLGGVVTGKVRRRMKKIIGYSNLPKAVA
jgi:hypothetical protein